jgi:SAM-dependent methyltransferase
LTFRQGGVEDIRERDAYDLVVLDNVYEHLPYHALALFNVSRALRPGGVLYMVIPNRAWPIEAHYRLPFLAWLRLPLANAYLRLSRRGTDYTDASYAPTLWGLRKQLDGRPELAWRLVLPEDPTATMAGTPWHYRLGMALLRRAPALWSVSKAVVVVAVKDQDARKKPAAFT